VLAMKSPPVFYHRGATNKPGAALVFQARAATGDYGRSRPEGDPGVPV
jgi:hypothetical protein